MKLIELPTVRPTDLLTAQQAAAEAQADRDDNPGGYCPSPYCLAQPDGIEVYDGRGHTVMVCETCGYPLEGTDDAELSADIARDAS